MALETATYIDGLVATNPTASDAISTADDHLRLIKSTIKATFPAIAGPVTLSHSEINALPGDLDSLETTLTAAIASAVASTKQALYPVGSIYTNATNNTNPATILGFGTWTAFGAGRVMVGHNASDPLFDTAEETVGSKDAIVVSHTHTATVTDPGHRHTFNTSAQYNTNNEPANQNVNYLVGESVGGQIFNANAAINNQNYINTNTTGITVSNSTTGSSGTNANLQPYITVYMWKRTA
jgi:hypothetical protein